MRQAPGRASGGSSVVRLEQSAWTIPPSKKHPSEINCVIVGFQLAQLANAAIETVDEITMRATAISSAVNQPN
jgi:hypothetical protein